MLTGHVPWSRRSKFLLLHNPILDYIRNKPDWPITKGLKRLLKGWRYLTATRPVQRVVPIDRLLCGGEYELSAPQYARHTGNFLRPSTSFERSPHVQFLEQYQKIGDDIFHPDVFKRTAYFANAVECINAVGRYFGCTSEDQVEQIARRFVAHFSNGAPVRISSLTPHVSPPGSMVRVQPVMHSDCYAIVDGNHRLAIAYVRGERTYPVSVEAPAILTPLQELLLDCLRGGPELCQPAALCQPIASPELDSWVIVRRCTDRFEKIRIFLEEHGLTQLHDKSYLDIGCSYGWFVREMGRLAFDAHGVEIDWAAVEIGRRVYGLKPCQVTRSALVRYLKGHQRSYDVVSCFSVLHNFVMGRESISAEEMLKLIEKVTGTVLFFETGESHETWFRDSLSDWNADDVESWLADNSSFTKIYRLGTDCDNVSPFADNYGRTLFACMRY